MCHGNSVLCDVAAEVSILKKLLIFRSVIFNDRFSTVLVKQSLGPHSHVLLLDHLWGGEHHLIVYHLIVYPAFSKSHLKGVGLLFLLYNNVL